MAGSLNHIVDDHGRFKMDSIENLGDAREALHECHHLIASLLDYVGECDDDPVAVLEELCQWFRFPVPKTPPVLGDCDEPFCAMGK